MKTKTILLSIALAIITQVTIAQNFEWAKSMVGQTGGAIGFSITTDASGNVYTTGRFLGIVDFDPGAGVFLLTSEGGYDIFISKLDASGNFVWAKRIGGTNWDEGNSITTDASGNVYTTGYFRGTVDFDPGTGVFNLSSTSIDDIFISKLDASGNFVWAKRMGGIDYDVGKSIATDASGNVYTTGYFQGTVDFDPGAGVFNLSSAGSTDIFISKLDASGNFIWAKSIGGTNGDEGRSITTDASGNVYTTGIFEGTADFDPGAGVFNLSSTWGADIFISKLDASGNFVWAKNIIGLISNHFDRSITTDGSSNVYTTGYFQGTADFDPDTGVFNLSAIGGTSDIFISKLDASGNFVWAKSMGGTNGGDGVSITTDFLGNVYTTGRFYGTVDFDPGAATFNLTSIGMGDIFISKLDTSGNFVWAKSIGGTSGDEGRSISTDASNNVYTTGYFQGTVDFDPGAGIYNLTAYGGTNIFVHKMNQTTVGIIENTLYSKIKVYPNPTNGELTIVSENEFSNASLTVHNVMGQEVFHKNYSSGNQINFTLEVPAGVYFVEIVDREKTVILKVIKE